MNENNIVKLAMIKKDISRSRVHAANSTCALSQSIPQEAQSAISFPWQVDTKLNSENSDMEFFPTASQKPSQIIKCLLTYKHIQNILSKHFEKLRGNGNTTLKTTYKRNLKNDVVVADDIIIKTIEFKNDWNVQRRPPTEFQRLKALALDTRFSACLTVRTKSFANSTGRRTVFQHLVFRGISQ